MSHGDDIPEMLSRIQSVLETVHAEADAESRRADTEFTSRWCVFEFSYPSRGK